MTIAHTPGEMARVLGWRAQALGEAGLHIDAQIAAAAAEMLRDAGCFICGACWQWANESDSVPERESFGENHSDSSLNTPNGKAANPLSALRNALVEIRDSSSSGRCGGMRCGELAEGALKAEQLADEASHHAELVAALEWALTHAGTDHPSFPYKNEEGVWSFPRLIRDNPEGFGGGVAEASFPTALEAVQAATRGGA